MSTQPRFTKSADAKAAGWFSRRHKTSDAHRKAQRHYATRAERRPKQRWDNATFSWVHEARK